ncbi:winged helix-turn-helix transcriptional regulator [Lacticaseibacillus kribbianus]|uniref:winged helix-turn-helix transcriptional regulator n=1 Tax=Lacticaseibacillus kribbianus TaxID=2926292 RepID=UPI001CD251DB|nr:helix-turn-helix domain-containing protein [Lacticaseibacillus kribbianus]
MADIDYITENRLEDTGFAYTLRLIGGKYKMQVLYALALNHGPIRYNALKRLLTPISFKTLTNTLRELEAAALIRRQEFPQVPPRVEYSLSPRGESLIPVLDGICRWGNQHAAETKD